MRSGPSCCAKAEQAQVNASATAKGLKPWGAARWNSLLATMLS